MAFIESPRFPDCIAFGSQGGPGYNTSVIVLANGREQRNQNWELPIHTFDIAFGIKRNEDIQELLDFFHRTHGALDGFRFKNFTDYNSAHTDESTSFLDQIIGVADGVETDFQLKKTYYSGAYNNVTKPVIGTVTIGVNGVLQTSGYTVDYSTGIVTFAVAPAAGNVTAGFQYDLPVRFESDQLVLVPQTFIHGTASLRVVEIK